MYGNVIAVADVQLCKNMTIRCNCEHRSVSYARVSSDGKYIELWRPAYAFFWKGAYINIARYQLHPASATTYYPNGITDAHSQKIKEELQEKSPALVIYALQQRPNTTKTAPEV